jgi:FdhD protein
MPDGWERSEPVEQTAESMRVVRWSGGAAADAADELAPEEPLEIRVRGRAVTVTMRTPTGEEQDAELAAGFLLTEGIVRRREDVLKVEACGRNEWGNVINVLLGPLVHVDFERLTRHVFASSSCGLCGKGTIEAIRATVSPVESALRVSASFLATMPARMRERQEMFERTGAVHAAGLFESSGESILVREDVGRHNAVDKVIGHTFLNGMELRERVLVVSGRISFEIVQKAAVAGVPLVAGVSAPTALAVRFAEEMGVTVVGFVREGRLNVYSHGARVVA